MPELPPDPFVYDWYNTCRNCGSFTLVDKRGYCCKVCFWEDLLPAWADKETAIS